MFSRKYDGNHKNTSCECALKKFARWTWSVASYATFTPLILALLHESMLTTMNRSAGRWIATCVKACHLPKIVMYPCGCPAAMQYATA